MTKKAKQNTVDENLESDDTELEYMVEDDGPTTILLFGDINDDICAQACNVIIGEQYRPEPKEKIRILINSPGGELQAAFALIEVMEASRIPIETIALGQCVQAAMLILMSGSKGHRIITRTCASMSHTYSTDVGGSHWDIKEIQRELQNTQDRILDQYMKCTGLPKQKIIKNLIGKSDRWLNPTQVVEYNIADRIGKLEF